MSNTNALHIQEQLNHADKLFKQFEFEQTIGLYEQILKLIESEANENTSAFIAEATAGLVDAYSESGKIFNSTERIEKGIAAAERSGDLTLLIKMCKSARLAYTLRAEYSKAIESYERLIPYLEDTGNLEEISYCYNQIAGNYYSTSKYVKAMEYMKMALENAELAGSNKLIGLCYQNLGIFSIPLGNLDKSLEYFHNASKSIEAHGDKKNQASILMNLGSLYILKKEFALALQYLEKTIEIFEEVNDLGGLMRSIGNIGICYTYDKNYTKAIEYLSKADAMAGETGNHSDRVYWLFGLGDAYSDKEPADFNTAESMYVKALEICKEYKHTQEAYLHLGLSKIYERQEKWKEADWHYQEYHRISSESFTVEVQKQYQKFLQERDLMEYEKKKAIENASIEANQQATETLLYKLMPGEIAQKLIDNQETIADYYPNVSILFADLQGFSSMTSELPPYMLLQLLHNVFSKFDSLTKAFGCTKIKTISDGYMVVSGAPEICEDHAERIINLAFEMAQPIVIPAEIEMLLPDHAELKVRVGIHSGSVVAGVVGQERFGYDIYSDAVNIASRMQTTGVAGKIHVSSDFMRHLLSRFASSKNSEHGLVFERRGEIPIKGKGMMKTFFVTRQTANHH